MRIYMEGGHFNGREIEANLTTLEAPTEFVSFVIPVFCGNAGPSVRYKVTGRTYAGLRVAVVQPDSRG